MATKTIYLCDLCGQEKPDNISPYIKVRMLIDRHILTVGEYDYSLRGFKSGFHLFSEETGKKDICVGCASKGVLTYEIS